MYELRFDAEDFGRVRFAISPLWETVAALRLLVDTRQRPYHLPWLQKVKSLVADVDVAPLVAVQPVRGYTPDFLTPLPDREHVTIEAQLDAVRATPLSRVRLELRRAMTERDDPVPEELRSLAARPKVARERFATALEQAWRRLVEPHWPRLRDLLEADVAHHSRVLARGGLQALFPALSPHVRWSRRAVRVRGRHEPAKAARVVVRLGGRGLVVQPTAFGWPFVVVVTDRPWQPALVYPARGIDELWQPAPTPSGDALARLLGRTRATLLASLREPASTTALARRHELAAATVSEHLLALADAGLIAKTRLGRSVLYSTTPLGEALLRR